MMQLIRSTAGKILVPILMVFFLGWMVFEIGMDALGGGLRGGASDAGSVNGESISAQAYSDAYQALYQQAQAQMGEITPEMQRRIEEQAWETLVDETLLRQELQRRGIRVSDQEVIWAAKNLPHPQLMQQEIFLTNGRFDITKYRGFLASQAPAEIFGELERYYRDDLPRRKLVSQLAAGRYITDAELWRAYQDRTETATVDYVQLDLSKLKPAAVTDAEMRAYYEENRDDFRRTEGASFKVAYVPLTITEADRQATVARARALRQQILAAGDTAAQARLFAELAGSESADQSNAAQGGSLGTFGRGQMVASFDSAAFALQPGQVSEPVITQFGVHLVRMDAREGEQVTARHILLEFAKSDEEIGRIEQQLNAIRDRAASVGLVRAAQGQPNVTVREQVPVSASAPMVPGVGAAMEAINWARDESADRASGDVTGRPVSDVMETDDALYLVELERFTEAGMTPYNEAQASIRQMLETQKRVAAGRAEADKMLAEIRQGRTLEQVAQARGLTVQRTGPFSRVDPNPVFGQANAAIGAAFGTPVGQVGPVAATPAAVFLVRPVSRTAADRRAWEQQKQGQREQAQAALQQDLFRQWLLDARQNADIEDNRAELNRRSRAAQS
ncbi:peptidylprolyl isomerase [Longimicrobium sp.]|uniref:peptidylprolyl isomerase n=1 Tax=Longimicrobium sp. TaxID=2029185 RepID=UPI002E30EFD8|nr:SurA N-terminal domain-containing protein [Longimicrobium sp.]HEX6038107.1 SurA N-terminal domain-containing protein [Longimicrobium sp.]